MTAVANDLVLVELAGGQHSLFYNPLPFTQFQPRFGRHFVTNWPTVPGLLILRPGQDCLFKALHVLFLGQAQLTAAKSLWTTVLLVCYDPGNGCCLLLVPTSRVTLLQSLILQNCTFGQLFQVP